MAAYGSEAEPINRRQNWQPVSVDYTSFYRDSVHKNKVGHNNTRGTVSSLLFFPLNLLLHKVYISNIFCGYGFKTPIVKRSLSLAMFISTS
jgi:hypothetical protein